MENEELKKNAPNVVVGVDGKPLKERNININSPVTLSMLCRYF